MKNRIFFLLLVTATVYCGAQTKASPEKFQLRKLSENGKILNSRTIDKKNTITRVGKLDDGYFEDTYSKGTPYGIKKAYFKNRALKTTMKLFYKVPIGVQNIFSENGTLASSKDYNEERKFSIDQLIQKMKTDFNIDFLTDSDKKGVDMSITKDNRPYYKVVLSDYYSDGIHRNIGIDANNGEVLIDEKFSFEK